jgi:hypothetical protein
MSHLVIAPVAPKKRVTFAVGACVYEAAPSRVFSHPLAASDFPVEAAVPSALYPAKYVPPPKQSYTRYWKLVGVVIAFIAFRRLMALLQEVSHPAELLSVSRSASIQHSLPKMYLGTCLLALAVVPFMIISRQ